MLAPLVYVCTYGDEVATLYEMRSMLIASLLASCYFFGGLCGRWRIIFLPQYWPCDLAAPIMRLSSQTSSTSEGTFSELGSHITQQIAEIAVNGLVFFYC